MLNRGGPPAELRRDVLAILRRRLPHLELSGRLEPTAAASPEERELLERVRSLVRHYAGGNQAS